MAEASVQLHPKIRELAGDFQLQGGRVAMPDERLLEWGETLAAVPPGERATYATELIALAFKFARRAGDQAAYAITQLFILATYLLGSRDAAEQAFENAGIDAKEAARLTGRKLEQVTPEPMKPGPSGVGLRKK